MTNNWFMLVYRCAVVHDGIWQGDGGRGTEGGGRYSSFMSSTWPMVGSHIFDPRTLMWRS